MRWIALALLALGCVTRPVLEPWPCQRIAERPQVDVELMEMRALGIYRATREWAVAADAKCAADRALVGEKADESLSWWERSWLGGLLR